jgi:hypothetical protein
MLLCNETNMWMEWYMLVNGLLQLKDSSILQNIILLYYITIKVA